MKTKSLVRLLAYSAAALTIAEAVPTLTDLDTCGIDPSCHAPTPSELAAPSSVYGSSIDYDKVRIYNRRSLFAPFTQSSTVGHKLFLSGPTLENLNSPVQESREEAEADLVHEFGHIAQNQHHGRARKFSGMPYEYRLTDHPQFLSFNREQQSKIAEDFYLKRKHLEAFIKHATNRNSALIDYAYFVNHTTKACRELSSYRDKLVQVYNVPPLTLCGY